ncbi:type IA DNA topoisomerase [Janthinobacterium sp. CAN_S7]|uniref:type IA DNA topoisomerase n=1 Tax=Janthinobacterium sp. CAN_S7 TaxID=3071704 RepID=UPI00319E924D
MLKSGHQQPAHTFTTMPPIILIVESPNKAKKANEMFAGQIKAIASFGHVCDLPATPKDGIGIDRASMQGQYALTEDKTRTVDGKRSVAKIKKFINDNPGAEIILGTDADREGESIAAFLMKYLPLSPSTKRACFNAITKEKIELAINTAGHINLLDVNARETRRLTDRIIGYPGSTFLRNALKRKDVSAGRVQTAVEALVVERERKIRNHKSQPYYSVHFDLGGWEATWQVPASTEKRKGPKPNSEYDTDDKTPRCFNEATAREIANQRALSVEDCTETTTNQAPPSPLYTISLIQIANRILGWDAEKTMEVAQKLFEGDGSGHGHITYHRTDSPNIDPAAAEEIRTWLQAQGLPIPPEPNSWQCKNKQAQEGHEAIRPSYFEVTEAGATPEQQALYKLIRERAIYSQLAPARFASKRILLSDVATGSRKFTASARVLIDPGWLKTAAAKSPTMQDENAEDVPPQITLPTLQRGTVINIKKADVRPHVTKAPPRYTMNTLTSKLENLSIGRPATIASLLKNVQKKGTIVVQKDGKLKASELAEQCYDALYPRFTFASIGYTAELEKALDKIATGELDGKAIARMVWDRLEADSVRNLT